MYSLTVFVVLISNGDKTFEKMRNVTTFASDLYVSAGNTLLKSR